jgi:thioredoxin-dependent adenylylsulfate APS reductase
MRLLAPADVREAAEPETVLRWAFDTFPRVAIVSSFQATSAVLIDMAARITPDVTVVTLDTGRLPQETHDIIDRVRDRYGIEIEVVTPDPHDIREMVARHGSNLFRESPDLRRQCCDVRKTRPLARALEKYDAWITGIRRSQMATRAATPVVSIDNEHGGITKIAPLATWSEEQVWAYIRENDVPYHPLYDIGYTSIGCTPCTRATRPGEDARAGRWWWEQGEVKECGIHWKSNAPAREEAASA